VRHDRRVLVVDDGPTITHGGMSYGAGYVAAIAAGAADIVDPRLSAVPAIQEVYNAYPHIGRVLPAVGYSASQLAARPDHQHVRSRRRCIRHAA
jgi:predicted GTPase